MILCLLESTIICQKHCPINDDLANDPFFEPTITVFCIITASLQMIWPRVQCFLFRKITPPLDDLPNDPMFFFTAASNDSAHCQKEIRFGHKNLPNLYISLQKLKTVQKSFFPQYLLDSGRLSSLQAKQFGKILKYTFYQNK